MVWKFQDYLVLVIFFFFFSHFFFLQKMCSLIQIKSVSYC